MIAAGQLGPDDLLYFEGETKWRPLSEITVFQGDLPQVFEDKTQMIVDIEDPSVREWVLLVKGPERQRSQKGPFSTQDVRHMLRRGEVRLSDYVWRRGMKEWYRLQNIAVFHDFNNPIEPPKQSSDQTELLANVFQLSKKPSPEVPPPVETEGPDLVEVRFDPRDRRPEIAQVGTGSGIRLARAAKLNAKATVVPKGVANRVLRPPLTYQLGLSALLVLGGFWTWQAYQDHKAKKEQIAKWTKVNPTVVKPVQVKAEPNPNPIPTPPTAKKTVKVPPSFLRLSIKDRVLTLNTDGSKHFVATLSFSSVFGEVIDTPSYFRLMQSEDRQINLEALKWPPGQYLIEARIGDQEAQTRAFVGQRPARYQQELRAFNKGLTLQLIEERADFVRTTARLRDGLKPFQTILSKAGDPQAWARDFGPWLRNFIQLGSGKISRISRKNRNNYVMASMWIDLQVWKKDAVSFARRMSKPGERLDQMTQSELRALLTRIDGLYESAQNASFWR